MLHLYNRLVYLCSDVVATDLETESNSSDNEAYFIRLDGRANARKRVTPIQAAKLVVSPIASKPEQYQNKWTLKEVGGEFFYGGHFVSSVMTQEQYEKVCPFIVVKILPLRARVCLPPGN